MSDISLGSSLPALPSKKIDFKNPKHCGYFIFGILLFYIGVASLVDLFATFSINLMGIVSQSFVEGFQISDIRFAFSTELFTGLAEFESLRYLLSVIITSVLTFYVAFHVSGVKLRYVVPSKKADLIDSLCGIAFCVGAAYIGSVLADLIVELGYLFGLHLDSKLLMLPESTLACTIYFLALVIIPPFFEELLVRGFIQSALRGYGTIIALSVPSCIFALMHGSIPQIIQGLFFGIAAGYIVIKMENIWIAVAAHFIVNGSVFISMIAMSWYGYPGYEKASIVFAVVYTLCFVAAVAYSAIRYKEQLLEGLKVHTDRKRMKALLWNPVACCFYLVCALQFIGTLLSGRFS